MVGLCQNGLQAWLGIVSNAAPFLKKKKRSLMSGIPPFIVEAVDSRHTLRYVFTNVQAERHDYFWFVGLMASLEKVIFTPVDTSRLTVLASSLMLLMVPWMPPMVTTS